MDGWLTWLRVEKNRSPGTIKKYRRDLERLIESGVDPVSATSEQLRSWLWSTEGKPGTIAARLASLRCYYKFLVRSGGRADDPSQALDRPKVMRGLPRPVVDADDRIARLDPTTRRIAVVMRNTGLRLAEALSLDVGVPAPPRTVIRGKGAKDRLVLLNAEARAALDELGGRIPLSARTIQRRFRGVGFKPHALRHTFACELAAGGAELGEVQRLLGHSNPATTLIYMDYAEDRIREALDRRRPLS